MATRRESVVEAHQVYTRYHRHESHTYSKNEKSSPVDSASRRDVGTTASPTAEFPMFHTVMKTGVIYATSRAVSHGFTGDDSSWANMGQGAPETSE
jgi:hypothetical protein